MALTLTSYWPLALLTVLPFVWWMSRRTLTNFNARQRRLQAGVRAALLASVSLALAAPVLSWTTSRLAVVFAVDVSDSIASDSLSAAARWIEGARHAGRADTDALLAFAGEARPVGTVREIAAFAASAGDEPRPASGGGARPRIDRERTDIEAVLATASGTFPPGHVRHLVLLTDGRPTDGDLAAGIVRLQRAGVRVFTVPLAERRRGDAWIDGVIAPADATADEPFGLTVTLHSQVPRSGVLHVTQEGRPLVSRPLQLAAGPTTVALDLRLPAAGAQAFDVELVADGDPDPANNHERVPIVVGSRPRVLYVEGRASSAGYLTRALASGGLDVEAVPPARLPARPDALQEYGAVILSDVPRRALDEAQMEAVEAYVAAGGGLIVAGGESMYGVDGYADTPIERVLPATFSMKDRPDEFAMVVVLDKSWSMVGEKIELAKEAARAALEVLPDRHRLGVIAFNDGFEWAVPLQPASNREDIARRIRAIVPSGHTNLFPAVESAFKVLDGTKAGVKHVFILSDGRTYPDEYESLVKRMVARKITVSSVAVGEEADRELLANLATWGRGRSYSVDNPADVPQIFVKETERAIRSTFVEAPFRPSVKKPVELLRGLDMTNEPPLAGYARMQTKDTAEAVLVTGEDEDPVLARWQYGLGRTAVFTSDVKDRWARDWISWSGYGKFWTQFVRETLRREDPAETPGRPAMRIVRAGRRAVVDVDLIDAGGAYRNLQALHLEVETPASGHVTLPVFQIGPGAYRGVVPLRESGGYALSLEAAGETAPLDRRRLIVEPDVEERLRPPDLDLLKAISRDTGGLFNPGPADLFTVGPDRARTSVPLWPYLAALAAILWLVDLALRRVRLFEAV